MTLLDKRDCLERFLVKVSIRFAGVISGGDCGNNFSCSLKHSTPLISSGVFCQECKVEDRGRERRRDLERRRLKLSYWGT